MRMLETTRDPQLQALIRSAGDAATTHRGGRLGCAACLHEITQASSASTRSGQHRYRRVNPHGITYEFAIFSSAPGCADRGAPTEEHTWFRGCAWVVAVCGRCAAHLGWRFAGRDAGAFFGLITANIVPLPEH